MKSPRQYSLVRHNNSNLTTPFNKKQVLIYFGEIPNMPGHCIVADTVTGEFYFGYHIDRFEEIPEDET